MTANRPPRLEDAGPADAERIARLLARPMPGAVRLALAPRADAPADVEERRHAIVVRAADGAVVAHGARTVRRLWLDGRQQWVGYLHGLRRDESVVDSGRTIARGLRRLAATRAADEADHDLTAVIADNERARRVLERMPGAPTYHPLGGYATFIVSIAAAMRWPARDAAPLEPGDADAAAQVQDLVDRHAHHYAPCVAVAATRDDWSLLRRGGRVVGAVRRWDRRRQRSATVEGYVPGVRLARPLLNLIARIRGRPVLPSPGRDLGLVHAAHLVCDEPASARALIAAAARVAAADGASLLAIGVGERHPLLPALAALPAWRLDSRLYAVGAAPASRGIVSPEAALL